MRGWKVKNGGIFWGEIRGRRTKQKRSRFCSNSLLKGMSSSFWSQWKISVWLYIVFFYTYFAGFFILISVEHFSLAYIVLFCMYFVGLFFFLFPFTPIGTMCLVLCIIWFLLKTLLHKPSISSCLLTTSPQPTRNTISTKHCCKAAAPSLVHNILLLASHLHTPRPNQKTYTNYTFPLLSPFYHGSLAAT